MTDSNPHDSLAGRIFLVVETLVRVGDPIGPRALAREANVERSAVARILKQLTALGVVERVDGAYIAGPRLFALSWAAVEIDTLSKAALPIIQELSDQFKESCYVCLRQGDEGVMTHKAESDQPVRYVIKLNAPFPLYAGASGRAILAGLPEPELTAYLDRTTFEPVTPATVTSRQRIVELTGEARRLGYSTAFEEVIPGGWAVSSPFFDRAGTCVGAIILTSPMSRLDRSRIPEFGEAVRDASTALSERLGFRPTD